MKLQIIPSFSRTGAKGPEIRRVSLNHCSDEAWVVLIDTDIKRVNYYFGSGTADGCEYLSIFVFDKEASEGTWASTEVRLIFENDTEAAMLSYQEPAVRYRKYGIDAVFLDRAMMTESFYCELART